MCLGNNIKIYLDNNGIKYSYLSQLTDIPMNILSPILNGKRKIIAEEYFIICKALKLPIDYFEVDPQAS